ncbi:MAG: ATP-dependent DNA ligase [Desulfurococcales archaeon]|nr:ATP-dependent DNA ligase [Desulfurococcales archaeon]
MERITSRTQLTLLLVGILKKTPARVIDKVVYLIQGKIGPEWKDLPELGIGEKMLIKAISLAYRTSEQQVERLYKSIGDLGKVAETLSARAGRPAASGLLAFMETEKASLTVSRVYDTLLRIAYAQGEGSRDLKLRLLSGLLADAKPKEAKYIVRFVEGRLRVGIGDATVLDALAIVFGGGAQARPIVERAYNLRADLGMVASLLAQKGLEALQDIGPMIGIPIRPMLAERGKSLEELFKKVGGKAIVEYKYDGERAQIHKKDDQIYIFSRRMENITNMYPDVVSMARERIKAREAIVEGEIVAIDPETLELRPFQELMHRKRKHDIYRVMKEVPVAVFLFDVLYADGKDLTKRTLLERRRVLEDIVDPTETFAIAKYVVTDDVNEAWRLFLEAVEEGAEGIMIKAIHDKSYYVAGVREWLWIKFKRDYKSEMMDTVDLVVVGAFYGRGKRGGMLSSLLMAAYDPERDLFKTVCKVATGFSDEELANMQELLEPLKRQSKHPRVESRVKPDVWIEPSLVAEILGAELTLSPMHSCCLDAIRQGVGISIRFPRFIRWRPDKRPEDATTEEELLEMYKSQLRKVEEAPAQEAV